MVGVQSALRLTMIMPFDPNIQTFVVLFYPRCSDVRICRQESSKRIFELRTLPMPRHVQALGWVENDRVDLIFLQQHGELSLGNRGATAVLTPLGIRIGRE